MDGVRVTTPTHSPRESFTERVNAIISKSPSKFKASSPFTGRSIAVVGDLSIDEQAYLYAQARRIKQAIKDGGPHLDALRINDPDIGIYLVFLGESTRTKNSFLSAAQFHHVKVNDFNCATSSFNKKESITDAIKMLTGYSVKQSIFIIRSHSEGACTWLHDCMTEYAEQMDLPRPAFINAGDGRHSHPTHEFFDEFSFLEQLQWDQSMIHIALVGDLFHGRTVHSKAEGLQVFRKVRVDLVAPAELQLPEDVLQKMLELGYHIRVFTDIHDYMQEPEKAAVWYFTNLHLDRFGDKLREKADTLHRAVLFREEWIASLGPDVRFYHPLPSHTTKVLNTVPPAVKDTHLNAWDNQALNAYYVRVTLLGMVAGIIGKDFDGMGRQETRVGLEDDFMEEASVAKAVGEKDPSGIKALVNGVVIDHIAAMEAPKAVWERIVKVRKVLKLNCVASHGVYDSTANPGRHKGIVSLPDAAPFSPEEMTRLAMIAPNCTVNVVQNGEVVHKYRLRTPPVVSGFKDIHCKNPRCISHPQRFESVTPFFYRSSDMYECKYCEARHRYADIWA
eukprot:EG_transcript_6792